MSRRIALLLLACLAATALQLGTAGAASAAPTCKSYDTYRVLGEATTASNARVCAAPSSDYPAYSGWGRIKRSVDAVLPVGCGFGSLLPFDVDDPMPPCLDDPTRSAPAPEYAWTWTGRGWTRGMQLRTGTRAYFAPFGGSWRWGWTAQTGWFALPAADAYFLWYA